MINRKMGNCFCTKRRWRVLSALMIVFAVFPANTLAENIATQLLVKRSAIYSAVSNSKPHPQLSKLMHDGEHSNGWQLWQLPDDADSAEVARQLNELYANNSEAIAELNQPRLPQLFTAQNIATSELINPNLRAIQQRTLNGAGKTPPGDASVVVAVIDDGVDLQHPGLREKIWLNDDEIAGDGIDNDGNGFVDDTHGWNFSDGNNDPGHQPEDSGHGTLVAGTIVGDYVSETGAEVAIGSAPGVRIMPLRISHDSHSLLQALAYAANNHADIVNISLGGILPSTAETEAIATLRDQGILVVAAAGNHHNNNDFRGIYPASYALPNILSVAAQDTSSALTGWSQYGSSSVDIAALGVGIISTARGGKYANTSGTSLATGFASGVAALIKSHYPTDNYQAIKARLLTSATPIDPPFVTRTDSGINAAAALNRTHGTATFAIQKLSSSIVGNQRQIRIDVEPYHANLAAPELADSALHCSNHPDGNTLSTQLITHNAYSLNYRVTLAANSTNANLRCRLSLTSDESVTTQRTFRITEPRRLEINQAARSTFQTNEQDDYQHWVVDIPAGRKSLEVFVRSEHNVDVLLKPAEAPRYVATLGATAPQPPLLLTDSETSRSASNSGFERLRQSNPAAGSWHIVVLNQQQQPNTRYTIEVTAHGAIRGEQAAIPLPPSETTTPNRAAMSDNGGGGPMFWVAILIAYGCRHRRTESAT